MGQSSSINLVSAATPALPALPPTTLGDKTVATLTAGQTVNRALIVATLTLATGLTVSLAMNKIKKVTKNRREKVKARRKQLAISFQALKTKQDEQLKASMLVHESAEDEQAKRIQNLVCQIEKLDSKDDINVESKDKSKSTEKEIDNHLFRKIEDTDKLGSSSGKEIKSDKSLLYNQLRDQIKTLMLMRVTAATMSDQHRDEIGKLLKCAAICDDSEQQAAVCRSRAEKARKWRAANYIFATLCAVGLATWSSKKPTTYAEWGNRADAILWRAVGMVATAGLAVVNHRHANWLDCRANKLEKMVDETLVPPPVGVSTK